MKRRKQKKLNRRQPTFDRGNVISAIMLQIHTLYGHHGLYGYQPKKIDKYPNSCLFNMTKDELVKLQTRFQNLIAKRKEK
jgi:hypothetical protein